MQGISIYHAYHKIVYIIFILLILTRKVICCITERNLLHNTSMEK